MVILHRKNSFKRGFKASRNKKSNENQIQFGEITQYAYESLKFLHKQPNSWSPRTKSDAKIFNVVKKEGK